MSTEILTDCEDLLRWMILELKLEPTNINVHRIKRIKATLEGIGSCLGYLQNESSDIL